MTKVTIIGQQSGTELKKKPIVFIKRFHSNGVGQLSDTKAKPNEYDNVELISKDFVRDEFQKSFDLIFAYHKDRNDFKETQLYLGHWNDGVVE